MRTMKPNIFDSLNTLPAKAVKALETVNDFENFGQFMKTLIPRIFISCSTLVAFALAGVCSLQNSNAQTQSAPAAPETSAQPAPPVTPPPDIFPTSPLAQVVRLTQAGVDPGVIMTYITNSGSTFNLDSEKIIYISDVGVPGEMVTAMMQRDQQLQQQFAAAQPVQQTQPGPAPETAPAGTAEIAAQPETPPAPVTVDYFNDTLSPYGGWVDINGYGRCWRPTIVVYDSSWQPYCDRGHWVYSDCGWYWASDYAWGATFHYGRWFRDTSVGWCWYPDTVWAPSWVTWRYSDNYCGWAPLPPRTAYQTGVGIVFNGGAVSAGFSFGLAANCFTFVPTRNFCDPHPRNFRAAPAQVTQIFNHTTVINNFNVINRTIVNHGIAVQNIANATRTTIRPVPVHELANSGARNRTGYVPSANHPVFTGNANSSARPMNTTQNHFPQPTAGQNPTPNRNWTAPQPAVNNYHPPTHEAPVQVPPANYNQQSAPARWQQTIPAGTPRNVTRNSEVRQNNSTSVPAPEHNTAPTHQAEPSPSPSGGGQSGGHNGNQNWPGH
jgi:hypothetical protein